MPAKAQVIVCSEAARYSCPFSCEVTEKAPPLSTTVIFVLAEATPPPPRALSLAVNAKLNSRGTEDKVSHVEPT